MSRKIIWVLNMTAGKPDSGWGERHYYFSKFWVKKGYEVKIISGSYNHLFKNQPKIDDKKKFTLEEVEDGITFCWVKIPEYDGGSVFKLWSMIRFAIRTRKLSAELLGQPEHILVSSMPIFPVLTGNYLKKKLKATYLWPSKFLLPIPYEEMDWFLQIHCKTVSLLFGFQQTPTMKMGFCKCY